MKDKHVKEFWECIDPDLRERFIRIELEETRELTTDEVADALDIVITYYGG